jgi:hypothetical protein
MDINNSGADSDYSGYISTKYRVIKAQLDYINSLVNEFNSDTQHLFKHILVSSLVNLQWDEWIPVYSGLISSKLRQASWKKLEEAGLIEVSDYCMFTHKSREFKVLDNLILTFLRLGQIEAEERFKADKYNLFNGKKDNKKQVSKTTDDSDNEYSELVTNSVKIIKESLFNMTEIKKHIAGLQAKLDEAIDKYGVGSKEYKTAFGQLKADETWFASVDNNALQIDDNIWSYTPVYRVKMSGRIYAIRGLQCCSREMKAAAYTGVDELRNYDLKASQVSGLQQQFELAGLDTTWLENYRSNPNAKKEYAAQVGVSVDTWKSCLCSLLFGASLSKPGKRTAKKMAAQIEKNRDKMRAIDTALLNYLYEESGRDEVKTLEYLDRFNKVVAPLKDQLDLWHDWLLKVWVLKAGRLGRGCIYLDNAAGVKLNYTKESKVNPEWKLKAMLSAFILQGIESAFIHALTVESIKHPYKVIANEHDGLVVLGEIPTEAVEVAAFRSGLKYAVLEEKAIA